MKFFKKKMVIMVMKSSFIPRAQEFPTPLNCIAYTYDIKKKKINLKKKWMHLKLLCERWYSHKEREMASYMYIYRHNLKFLKKKILATSEFPTGNKHFSIKRAQSLDSCNEYIYFSIYTLLFIWTLMQKENWLELQKDGMAVGK